jgi:fructose 1,6-bisphosphate aldolase/phosphatase
VEKITLSVIKANVGGFVGHTDMHEDVLEKARECLAKAASKELLIDSWTSRCGDDLALLMTHEKGVDNKEIHRTAW